MAAIPEMAFPETADHAEVAAAEARATLRYGGEELAVGLGTRVGAMGLLAFSWDLGMHGIDGESVMRRQGAVAVVNGCRPTGRRRLTLPTS